MEHPGNLTIHPVPGMPGKVKVTTDRPGERATSAEVDAAWLIDLVAQAAGLAVIYEPEG